VRKKFVVSAGAIALVMALAASVFAAGSFDFGLFRDGELRSRAERLYGVKTGLVRSSTASLTQEQAASNPARLAKLTRGLKAEVVTDESGFVTDMLALWPNDFNPTHLISCNEDDETEPGVQRINVATGAVETIVTGTVACDGIRRTPWHTILFSEEAGGGPEGGRVYELVKPLQTTGVLLDRATGEFSGGVGAENLAVRPALGRLSYEGFAIYPNGLVYYGDEKRPFEGDPGGAYFKFIPATLRASGDGAVTDLNDSPLAAGSVYGLRLGLREEASDYGQGTNYGFGTWVEVCTGAACEDVDLQAVTISLSLTGYYRPEDIDHDMRAAKNGDVKFCGNNTGNEDEDQLYGEAICITDGTIDEAGTNAATPEVQQFVVGHPELAMPDNMAYQPGRGNWIIHEDAATDYPVADNNDLWDCLPDKRDDDLLSDGCIRVATLRDLTAEWTGGIFDGTGKRFFVSVQHNISGTGVVLEITGWK